MLLDTNVLSEFMRPRPSAVVVEWLDGQDRGQLYVCAISRAEIELGLALMPAGSRQQALAAAARTMFEDDFAGRCLAFDETAAMLYGGIVAARTRLGRPISVEDAQIAAIACVHGLPLATRNVADFNGVLGLRVVNPWSGSP